MHTANGTLLDITRHHAATHGAATAFSFLVGSKLERNDITFAALDARARSMAAHLRNHGVQRGERVLVLHPASLDYVASLLGCFYAGAVAVPTYPPAARQLSRSRERIEQVVHDASAVAALGQAEHLRQLGDVLSGQSCRMLEAAAGDDESFVVEDLLPSDPAILQYSSGSTSTPKGVVLTHGNVVANEHQIQQAVGTGPDDVVLSWLPPFHDMGLLGGILHPLFLGVRGILMAPEAFIRRPVRWLQATSDYRASVLVAPNFAYDLCVRRIKASDRQDLDLSSVRAALCGAEPISGATLERFCDTYGPHGFDRQAIYPCYGLAEASIFVTGGRPQSGWNAARFEPHGLDVGLALGCKAGNQGGRELVSCGYPAVGTEVQIVDPHTRAVLPERNVGEIWLSGPSIADGYWRRPTETAQAFDAQLATPSRTRFLRTGDLGFMQNGELFVTGRRKDLIIIRGRNHYPQDIERTVQALGDAMVADGGAAFAVDGPEGDQLVVVQELDRRGGADAEEALGAALDAVVEAHGVTPAVIVLIRRGTLQKTASGKVRRGATRQRFLGDELDEVSRLEPHRRPAKEPRQGPAPGRAKTMLPPAPAAQEALQALRPLAALARDAGGPSNDAGDTRPPTPRPAVSRPVSAVDPVSRAAAEAFLRESVASRGGLSPEDVDGDAPLSSFGVDSLAAAELTEGLEGLLGAELPAEFVYDHPTLHSLAAAVARFGRGAQTACPTEQAPAPRPPEGHREGATDIAIVGLGCRAPRATSPDALWQLLRDGVDALQGPSPRANAGDKGGFLSDVAGFDASFFGISRREAERMDPRQRLLLEVAWEALEDAGIDPKSLSGTDAGVFVGACGNDYATHFVGAPDLIDADFASGNATSVIANRISYSLNLRGPSLTLDSACASSLAAIHAAREAILSGNCDLAIVGGVNVILSPETSIALEHARALSPTGRCRPFSRDADGFVRSEAVGVVVLQRADLAAAARRPARALLAGSAVNHNGRSNGLMAPNGTAQQEVIRRAHAAAGLTGEDIDYVETHGVGAPVADAVEAAALGAVLGREGRHAPCWLGSLKSNIGHTEAAAGVMSLIKATLCLQHGLIPKTLHYEGSPAKVDLAGQQLRLTQDAVRWPRGNRLRAAGVSAFGFGGANAHVVLKEARADVLPPQRARMAHLAVLSARTPHALSQLASHLMDALERGCLSPEALGSFCHTLNTGRAPLRHRAAILAGDASSLVAELDAIALGLEQAGNDQHPGGWRRAGRAPTTPPSLGVLMADGAPVAQSTLVELWQSVPAAREVFTDIDRDVRRATGASWLRAIGIDTHPDGAGMPVDQRQAEAVGRFAWYRIQWRLLSELDLRPSVVEGHGLGGIAAACATGRLSWRVGLQWLLHTLGGPRPLEMPGTMMADPDMTLLGAPPLMAGVSQMAAWVESLVAAGPAAPGAPYGGNLGVDVVLDLGGVETPPGGVARVRPLLPAELPAWTGLMETAGALFVLGIPIDLDALDRPFGFRAMPLPTYPFERERFWLPNQTANQNANRRPLSEPTPRQSTVVPARLSNHPLLRKSKVSKSGSDGTTGGPAPRLKTGA